MACVENTERDWPALLDDARGGCDVALGEICTQLRSYLLLIANDRMDDRLRAKFGASDIVQQSLIEAQHSIDRFRGSSEAELRVWLKRILIHTLLDENKRFFATQSRNIRQETRVGSVLSSLFDSSSTASAMMRHDETDQQLGTAIARLPVRLRSALEAKYRFGYSYSEIADQMRISEDATRKLCSRATQQLRKWLRASDD